MILRKFQEEAQAIAQDIASGVLDKKVTVANVTPGGGKTFMCSLFSHELVNRCDCDGVVVLCPKDSLESQMRDGFTRPNDGLTHQLRVYKKDHSKATQETLGARSIGWVSTYQFVSVATTNSKGHVVFKNANALLRIMRRGKWLLVLDEAHHLPTGPNTSDIDAIEAGWTKAVRPLVEAAHRVLIMTGTISRDDRAKVAFVEYGEDKKPRCDIQYTRRRALVERAVLPVQVQYCDGEARYWHRSDHIHSLSAAPTKETSRALRTLLNDAAYREVMLSDAVGQWEQYRDMAGHLSRMIVVCDTQKNAREVRDFIRKHFPKWRPVLAVESEKSLGKRELVAFRDRKEGHILITCQKAYEGLDVPDVTHLVCLTNIRSTPWLEQAFARATRFDPKCGLPWERQCAYLYVPADHDMIAFFQDWLEEQTAEFNDSPSDGTVPARRGVSMFRPESGVFTDRSWGDEFGRYSEADQKRIRAIESKYPNVVANYRDKLDLARDIWPNDDSVPEVAA